MQIISVIANSTQNSSPSEWRANQKLAGRGQVDEKRPFCSLAWERPGAGHKEA